MFNNRNACSAVLAACFQNNLSNIKIIGGAMLYNYDIII